MIMKLRPLLILSIIGLMLFAGCATVTFKRGAGPGNAKADEDACRASSASPETYADCLRDKGWMVRTPGSGTSASAAVAEPASTPTPVEPVPAPQPTPLPGGKPKTPPTKATPQPATTAKPAPAAAAPSMKPSPKPLDPLAHVTVQSWWKLGGTAAGLDQAIVACVGELGEAHRPSPAATDVTVGMRDCLRRAKWFPVGGTGAK